MKFAVFALLFTTAAAFQPPTMTFAVGKKKGPSPKAAVTKAVSKAQKAAGPQVNKAVTNVKAAAQKAAKAAKIADTKSKQKANTLFNQVKTVNKPTGPAASLPSVKSVVSKAKASVPSPNRVISKAKAAVPNVKPLISKAKAAAPRSAQSFVSKAKAAVPSPKPLVGRVKQADKTAKRTVASAVRPAVAKARSVAQPNAALRRAAAATRQGATKIARGSNLGLVPSTAIPYEQAPATLDGSFVGDVGFDPCFLSTKADSVAGYFNKLFANNANIDGLTWYREAELMHGRIAMIAVLGFIVPGFFTFNGNEWTGYDAFSYKNPLEELARVPSASLFQIFAFMAALEFRRINIIIEQGDSYQAGDSQRWGQGAGRWNPFNFNYTPEQYAEKQLQEIKHARLAMIGLLGLYFQANASGVNVVEQWSKASLTPDYYAKAGYFFPDGI